MKLKPGVVFNHIYLDRIHILMSVRNTKVLLEYFKILDVHEKRTLNDVQFYHFLHHITDLSNFQIMYVFDMFDWKGNGEIGFEEFYMLVAIIIANKDCIEKQFLYRHSRPIFDLFDIDGGRTISVAEFCASGFLFNMKERAYLQLFQEYAGTGDEHLTYNEFRLFILACVDKHESLTDEKRKFLKKQPKKLSDVYGF
ncbi:EF-hand calcium-binding domain-containing protein 9 [Callorhinchus milii]|uniref:EF-hand domain-containing protein n=1 Tax=Callorhinchus milii TaxID=7868 RepID=A0A4W3HE24_CALMI|nr:EF-hand calcium-binding domain-containing protein 9 [Callorhinchus milii]|eukprot:gi/632966729/ref/XP_007899577.1/ PREDICTED: EF-hand calcium-binding domain-containing protein 9 [Callorhinchus milii]